MNKERVKQLIDAYGADPEQWPSDERVAAVALLSSSSELQATQQSALALDRYFEFDQNSAINVEQATALANRVTAAVKPRSGDPSLFTSLVRCLIQPRYAIAFSIMFTAIIVMYVTPSTQPDEHFSQSEFDTWMLAQVTGELADEEAQSEWGFMDLVDLEVDAES